MEHNLHSVDLACLSKTVAWMHPITRVYDDPLRAQLRARFANYAPTPLPPSWTPHDTLWQRIRALVSR